MSYERIKLLHVLAGTGFIAVHGASMFLLHSIRNERSRDSIKAMLDFTARTTAAMYATLLAVVGTGVWLGFERSSVFRRGWYWWSLALLVATSVWMWFVARPFAAKLRAACELRPSGVPRVSDDELAITLSSRHSDLIAVVGFGALAVILTLMVLQPQSSDDSPVASEASPLSTEATNPPQATGPPTVSSVSTTEPGSSDVTAVTVAPIDTSVGNEADLLALGWEVFEVSAGGTGCASCHASDGLGTARAPGIVGSTARDISVALQTVGDMGDIDLTPAEVEAVAAYVRGLP